MSTETGGAEKPNPDSLPIIAEYSIRQTERDLDLSDALTGRGYQLAGFASVMLGLGALAQDGGWWLLVFACGALGAYSIVLGACLAIVLPRTHETAGSAKGLWEANWRHPPSDVYHALIERAVAASDINREVTDRKAKRLKIAVLALAAEATLVGVLVVAGLW